VKIGIIGADRIGGGLARQLAGAGHQVLLSFSRDRAALDELAAQIGSPASTGSPPDAAAFGEVVVISVRGAHCRWHWNRPGRWTARS